MQVHSHHSHKSMQDRFQRLHFLSHLGGAIWVDCGWSEHTNMPPKRSAGWVACRARRFASVKLLQTNNAGGPHWLGRLGLDSSAVLSATPHFAQAKMTNLVATDDNIDNSRHPDVSWCIQIQSPSDQSHAMAMEAMAAMACHAQRTQSLFLKSLNCLYEQVRAPSPSISQESGLTKVSPRCYHLLSESGSELPKLEYCMHFTRVFLHPHQENQLPWIMLS